MNHHRPSNDEQEFRNLIRDFPVDDALSLTEALRQIQSRFEKINTDQLLVSIRFSEADTLQIFFQALPLLLHSFLFDGILSNCGQYRLNTDPNSGSVMFGNRQQFKGVTPDNIPNAIDIAVQNLIKNAPDPIYSGVKFYQQFVYAHPFYDANGRIGRLMLELYFNLHNKTVLWKELQGNDKWLKKLNECHKRYNNQDNYERYVTYLVSHWKRFVLDVTTPDAE